MREIWVDGRTLLEKMGILSQEGKDVDFDFSDEPIIVTPKPTR